MIKLPIRKKLSNGLKIVLCPYDGIESVTVHLKGSAGSNYETFSSQEYLGTAHLLEHAKILTLQKLKKSSESYNSLLGMGCKIIAVTSRDDVLFMIKTLKNNLSPVIESLSNIFCKTSINEHELETLKKLIVNEIKRSASKPEKIINGETYKLLFPNSRLCTPNIGTIETVSNININHIKEFESKLYQPCNFSLVISGNINENVINEIDNLYSSFESVNVPDKLNIIPDNNFEYKNLTHTNTEQTFIQISYPGYKLSETQKYIADLSAHYINSLLKQRLTNDLGISYFNGCTHFPSGNFGIFSIYASCMETHLPELITHINTLIKNTPVISEKILEYTVNLMISDLIFSLEKTSGRAEYYSNLSINGRSYQNHKYEIKTLKNLTKNDVMNFVNYTLGHNPKICILSKDKVNRGFIEKVFRVN